MHRESKALRAVIFVAAKAATHKDFLVATHLQTGT
jgi:hypothetical protein